MEDRWADSANYGFVGQQSLLRRVVREGEARKTDRRAGRQAGSWKHAQGVPEGGRGIDKVAMWMVGLRTLFV
jgi:hypothetical protein